MSLQPLRYAYYSPSSRVNISLTVLPKYRAIFRDRTVEGINFPSSMALIVCRLTPTASASCCWEIFTTALSTRILFSIMQGPPRPDPEKSYLYHKHRSRACRKQANSTQALFRLKIRRTYPRPMPSEAATTGKTIWLSYTYSCKDLLKPASAILNNNRKTAG